MTVRGATRADLEEIVTAMSSFWDGRDVRALHHPMFVEGFRDTALVCPAEGRLAGYLFGLVAETAGQGYVHLAAVRDTERRRGLGRLLYERFGELAGERGCTSLKAVTQRSNEHATAFHRSLGMEPHDAPEYGREHVVWLGGLPG